MELLSPNLARGPPSHAAKLLCYMLHVYCQEMRHILAEAENSSFYMQCHLLCNQSKDSLSPYKTKQLMVASTRATDRHTPAASRT